MNTDIAAAAWNEAPASLLEENTTRPTAPTEGLINQRIAPKKDCKAPLPQAPLATKIDHLASHGSLNVLDQNRLILRESIHRGIEVTKERVKGGRVVGLGDEQRDDKRAYYEQERGAASASIHHSTTRIITHYTHHHQLLLLLLHPPQQLLTHHIPLTKQPSTYSPWICNGSTDSIEIHPCEP